MTADEMRISDWSSDVCSSDLIGISLFRGDAVGSGKGVAHTLFDNVETRRQNGVLDGKGRKNLDELVMASARFDDEPAFEAGADARLSALPRLHGKPAHHATSARRKAMLVRQPFQPTSQLTAPHPRNPQQVAA